MATASEAVWTQVLNAVASKSASAGCQLFLRFCAGSTSAQEVLPHISIQRTVVADLRAPLFHLLAATGLTLQEAAEVSSLFTSAVPDDAALAALMDGAYRDLANATSITDLLNVQPLLAMLLAPNTASSPPSSTDSPVTRDGVSSSDVRFMDSDKGRQWLLSDSQVTQLTDTLLQAVLCKTEECATLTSERQRLTRDLQHATAEAHRWKLLLKKALLEHVQTRDHLQSQLYQIQVQESAKDDEARTAAHCIASSAIRTVLLRQDTDTHLAKRDNLIRSLQAQLNRQATAAACEHTQLTAELAALQVQLAASEALHAQARAEAAGLRQQVASLKCVISASRLVGVESDDLPSKDQRVGTAIATAAQEQVASKGDGPLGLLCAERAPSVTSSSLESALSFSDTETPPQLFLAMGAPSATSEQDGKASPHAHDLNPRATSPKTPESPTRSAIPTAARAMRAPPQALSVPTQAFDRVPSEGKVSTPVARKAVGVAFSRLPSLFRDLAPSLGTSAGARCAPSPARPVVPAHKVAHARGLAATECGLQSPRTQPQQDGWRSRGSMSPGINTPLLSSRDQTANDSARTSHAVSPGTPPSPQPHNGRASMSYVPVRGQKPTEAQHNVVPKLSFPRAWMELSNLVRSSIDRFGPSSSRQPSSRLRNAACAAAVASPEAAGRGGNWVPRRLGAGRHPVSAPIITPASGSPSVKPSDGPEIPSPISDPCPATITDAGTSPTVVRVGCGAAHVTRRTASVPSHEWKPRSFATLRKSDWDLALAPDDLDVTTTRNAGKASNGSSSQGCVSGSSSGGVSQGVLGVIKPKKRKSLGQRMSRGLDKFVRRLALTLGGKSGRASAVAQRESVAVVSRSVLLTTNPSASLA